MNMNQKNKIKMIFFYLNKKIIFILLSRKKKKKINKINKNEKINFKKNLISQFITLNNYLDES